MTYKPDSGYLVVFIDPKLGNGPDGVCAYKGVQPGPWPVCDGGPRRGFIYLQKDGLWAHTNCYHRNHGFPKGVR